MRWPSFELWRIGARLIFCMVLGELKLGGWVPRLMVLLLG